MFWGLFSGAKNKILSLFLPETFKWFVNETHVYRRSFIFCILLRNDRALILHLHFVALLVSSVTMARSAKTTQKLNM